MHHRFGERVRVCVDPTYLMRFSIQSGNKIIMDIVLA